MPPLPFHATVRGHGAPVTGGGTTRSGLCATVTGYTTQAVITYYSDDHGAAHVLITVATVRGERRRTFYDGPESGLLPKEL